MAPGQTRKGSTLIIGIGQLPKPEGNNSVKERELNRRARARNANQRFAFRMVSKILKDKNAAKALEKQLDRQRSIF